MALIEPPALTDGPADPRAAVAAAPRIVLRRRPLLGSRRRQIGAAAVIAAAVAFLIVEGLGNATEYYKTVPQAVADRAKLGTTQFRIMGTVGSDVRQVGHQTEFTISYSQVSTQVVDSREPPQLFKPGIPVVLEGHWSGPVFQSDLIMVKHTAIYNPAEKAVFSTIPGAQSPPAQSPATQPPAGHSSGAPAK
jgi:cytochrome c-type biogenesis protein CcmE